MLYAVKCEHYTTPPIRDRRAAERKLVRIEELGQCPGSHRVIECDRDGNEIHAEEPAS